MARIVCVAPPTFEQYSNDSNIMQDERIMTLHPTNKQGVNILKRRYDSIKDFILNALKDEGEMTYVDIDKLAKEKLKSTFDGKVGWYVVTVKLDLEARDIIERIPKTSPHRIRIKKR